MIWYIILIIFIIYLLVVLGIMFFFATKFGLVNTIVQWEKEDTFYIFCPIVHLFTLYYFWTLKQDALPELVKGAACKAVLYGFEPYRRLIINLYCGVDWRWLPARSHKPIYMGSSPIPATNIRCHTAKFGIHMTFNHELTLRHLFLMLFICK